MCKAIYRSPIPLFITAHLVYIRDEPNEQAFDSHFPY